VPTPDEPHRVAEADGFGGFQRGHLHLALPMAALREVVPLGAVTPWPCPAPCVLGGLSLRGATVPVIDLLVALGGERSAPAALPIVVILVHAGRILGLLADAVTGVFQCAPGGLSRCGASDALAALLAGNILRQDGAGTVSVLSPAALVQLHQLPLVDDPEPERAHLDHGDVGGAVNTAVQGDAAMPVVLLRCGQLPLAIDAMAVYATVAHQQILPSVLARGHCKGVIDFAGSHIPALDLQAVCGFGPSDPDDLAQAIVLRLEAGMVAMLVGEVIDVVRCAPGDVITVPAPGCADRRGLAHRQPAGRTAGAAGRKHPAIFAAAGRCAEGLRRSSGFVPNQHTGRGAGGGQYFRQINFSGPARQYADLRPEW
jgi:purine-binding chemotaxis protein CheW